MSSHCQHGYTYDLFISYSSRDQDWLLPFVDDLTKDVNKFADYDIFPFLDRTRLQPGFVWDQALTSAAADSALLLPILSPRFFQSDYCQKEINAFVGAFGLQSAQAYRSRILPVKFLCSAPKDHALAALQATPFCTEGSDNIPIEFRQGTPQYQEGIRKLAVSIAQLLKTTPRKGQQRPAVYVAADFKADTDKLRASLAHTYDVLPNHPQDMLTMPAAELEQTLANNLSRCFVSIHTLTDAPLVKPLMEAQLAAALQQAKPRLILAPAAPPELLNQGFEWLTSPAEAEDRVRRLSEKPPERKTTAKEPLIYFLCSDRLNKEIAAPLLNGLETRGIRVYPSPLDGPADQALQTHIQALDELDGCLIYYGDASQDWFNSVFLRIAKKIRQRGLPSAIFLAPPPTDHKTKDLSNLGVPLVREADAAARAFLANALGASAP
jgi:hypothetical protein